MIVGRPFKAIAAMAENRVIGADGTIPWHIPDEFKWFKEATMGHTLVMGRKTYASIGRPLPGRKTVVLSRQPQEIPGVTVVDSLDAVPQEGTVFIAGGAEIYRQALPYCHELFLTIVKRQAEGNVLFPELDPEFRRDEKPLREHADFTVWRYVAKF